MLNEPAQASERGAEALEGPSPPIAAVDEGGRNEKRFLTWQFETYPKNHTTRANLVVHIITVPMFHLGLLSLIVAPISLNAGAVVSGFVGMALAVAIQGITHKREAVQPYPFRGPLDVLGRIFAEQLITFPRFFLSGAFFEAWRDAE